MDKKFPLNKTPQGPNLKNAKPKFSSAPLEGHAARAAAAAKAADIARLWNSLDLELGALQGGAVADLLTDFGLRPEPGRALGRGPAPNEGFADPGLGGPEDARLNAGLPRNQRHRSTAGLGAPNPKEAMGGSAAYGATPVPGQSSAIIGPGGKAYSTLMSDGTRVTVGEGWRGGNYHIFSGVENSRGESTTTTVVIAPDGRSAIFVDNAAPEGSNAPNSTSATGDPEVIRSEQERRDSGDGDEFDDAPPEETRPAEEPTPPPRTMDISVDPDAPGNSPWGYYNPFTGQYWGPYKKLNANQVNPGRDTNIPLTGPQLKIDPRAPVINPNPEALQGKPELRDPRRNSPNQVDPPRPQ